MYAYDIIVVADWTAEPLIFKFLAAPITVELGGKMNNSVLRAHTFNDSL